MPSPAAKQIARTARLRQTALYFTIGAGSPEGLMGLEAVHRFGDYLELATGIGEGFAASQAGPNQSAVQWSVMPRVRSGGTRHNYTFGAGMSGGPYATEFNLCIALCSFMGPTRTYLEVVPTYYTLWANVEMGGEYWSRGGFAVRYSLGYAHGMPLGSPSSTNGSFGLDIPYVDVGLGYAF